MVARQTTVLLCACTLVVSLENPIFAGDDPQYRFGDIVVPKASADESIREHFSLPQAVQYLDHGALAWSGSRKCISCHTTGTYMLVRPALTAQAGPPPKEMRERYIAALKDLAAMKRDDLQQLTRPGQVIYAAAGLAEWDAHVARSLSPETKQALALMFELQQKSGTWRTLDCWPPYESDAFHEATVAAIAVADAPGWLKNLQDSSLRAGVDRLKQYLRTARPPHDYGRVLLLWASARMPDLLTKDQQRTLIEMIERHQCDDGGWSIRTFAAPEEWGRGNRAAKLRREPEFNHPTSDGHMTGMALLALREAGVPAADPRIQRGVAWLLKNQRVSGRWWTCSMNTDAKHYITFSGTALPLLALEACHALPIEAADTAH
jgi:squalene-hopene/tetraprenyl-beta-curcumene cyclase